MRLFSLLLILAGSTLIGSCAMCGACADAVVISVMIVPLDGPVTASPGLMCADLGDGRWECTAYELTEGDHAILVSAPGYDSQSVSFTIGPPRGGDLFCSACPDGYYGSITL